MKTREFLSHLRNADVRLWLVGDRLRVSAPDGVLTLALQAELAERKAEIVAFLRQAQDAIHSTAPPILPIPREGPLPLSFAQQRLWFLDQLMPGTPFYNIPNAVRLKGQLAIAALKQGINEIIRRHESLRTTFAMIDGQAVQVIAPVLALPLPLIDLRQVPRSERKARAQRLAAEEARQPFDLVHGPLLRTTLLCLDDHEHVLLLTMHHIISDAWSGLVFLRELVTLYRAYAVGEPSPLSSLPVQYTDFAVWQQQWLQDGGLAEQFAYWKRRLDGALTIQELPTDRPRQPRQTFRAGSYSFAFPQALSEALKTQSQQAGVTLFATLLTALNVLLHRYTGQLDINVGTFVANRNRSQLEGLIGVFINLLVLRTDLSNNPTFGDLRKRVNQAILEAYAHQDLPFDKLLEELRPESDRGRSSLFRTILVLQNAPSPAVELPSLNIEWLRVEREAQPASELDLLLEETGEGLLGTAEYDADLFDRSTIARMIGHFQSLLETIVADSGQRISQVSFLTGTEQQRLLVDWNRTATEHGPACCAHELIEPQVEQKPDAVAVVCGREHLTYEALDRQANQLAHYLQTLGVGPDVLVGLCLDRSLEMVVGLLAILKAGGAYVPLDPLYPQARLSFLLEDAHIAVLLTRKRLAAQLPAYQGAVVCLDADKSAISQKSDQRPSSRVTPDNLLYVIYTSGSTGRPKGAGVYQRGFVNLLDWFVTDFQLTCTDSALLISSPSFDLTQKNFYAPLMIGGQLHLLPNEYYDPQQIREIVHDNEITWLNCTPSAFYPLLDRNDEGALAKLGSLRYLFLGGEPISTSSLQKWLESACCQATVVNTYGPTECTDICAFYRLDRAERLMDGGVPIGKPIHNAELFIVDRYLQPLPVGVVGELCVAGEGVGLGYVNDFRLTSAKFIPHPFGEEPGERLYRTGDLARYLPDGNIEFLGRMDHQVKVRGFRIELGEIETVLRQHPAVKEAVLVARETAHVPEQKHLVAYVVLAGQRPTPMSAELREFLQAKLPEHMIPTAFVQLDALPLTPNGKVDRKALPEPDMSPAQRRKEFVAPESPLEVKLAEIWAEVLGVEQVSVHDTFFDLGGYSLLATQVIHRVNEMFGIKLPMRDLFAEPTITRLALLVEEMLMDEFEKELGMS